jgi:hypothetical protein
MNGAPGVVVKGHPTVVGGMGIATPPFRDEAAKGWATQQSRMGQPVLSEG